MSVNGRGHTAEENRRRLLTDILRVSVRTVMIAIADGVWCVADVVD